MSEQRGARWLAREAQEIGAANSGDDQPSTGQHHTRADEPPRYPLASCMSDEAMVRWWLMMREFGVEPDWRPSDELLERAMVCR